MKLDRNDRVFIAGHRGMVGSAVLRLFQKEGFKNIITRTRQELNLMDGVAVEKFFKEAKPDYVVLAAAKVGGISANMNHQADFLYENLTIQNNVIYQAFKNGVKKFCFLGSSCIYPAQCPQPIKEEYLLTGPLEPTNEGYAMAKIAGYKLCYYLNKQYGFRTISLMPCNLYGPNDNFDPENSHVFAALIKKFADAADNGIESVEVWGSGRPTREFLHVDDVAGAVLFMMENREEPEFVNVGAGYDLPIRELAGKIAEYSGFKGKIVWNTSKPDGMLKKCMDVSRMLKIGYKPSISLDDGIKGMLSEYRRTRGNLKER